MAADDLTRVTERRATYRRVVPEEVLVLRTGHLRLRLFSYSSKSKSTYLNRILDTQVPKDTDAWPTKENNTTMKHTGLSELHPHKEGKVSKL